jgi:hemerythrin-like domain-containing protein
MCEYCGCQAVNAVDVLTREHDAVVNLLGAVQRALAAGDLDGAAQGTRSVAAVLRPHTRVEEDALFPPMAADFPEHVASLRAEHEQIEAVLAESADGTPADPAWPSRVADALHTLRNHILKEQDGLFPAALASLGPAEWEAVDETRRQVGTALTGTPVTGTPLTSAVTAG